MVNYIRTLVRKERGVFVNNNLPVSETVTENLFRDFYGATTFIEKIEQALDCMESAIRENIRNVDICTRYSSMQYLVILMEAGEDKIPLITERIFTKYYKIYSGNDFRPHYEFMPMLSRESD